MIAAQLKLQKQCAEEKGYYVILLITKTQENADKNSSIIKTYEALILHDAHVSIHLASHQLVLTMRVFFYHLINAVTPVPPPSFLPTLVSAAGSNLGSDFFTAIKGIRKVHMRFLK